MSTDHPLHAAFVAVYLLALVGVGALKARKVKSQADFSLAGRGLPTFVLVGTLLATWIGTGSIFGNAEETVRVGMPAFLLPVAGALGIVALWLLAARIRRFEQFTIQDILEARYGPAARVLGTLTLLCAYVIIVSYQYRAGAIVARYVWPDLGRETAIVIVAVFVIAYTALAGMFSVAYTDVANGILMTLGIAITLPIILAQAGGWHGVMESLPPEQRSVFGHYGVTGLLSRLLPAFLLLLGDANMYQRFFAARDAGSARRSAAWMLVGVVLLECAIIATALVGSALVNQGRIEPLPKAGHVVVAVAFQALPELLGAVLVATVVAVIVSTADSYLLSPSTSLVRDVYQRFVLRGAAEDRHVVLVGRVTVVLLGLVALGLAFTSDEFFNVALFAYTLYGAAITPPLIAAFFWRRATSAGAVAAIAGGLGTAIAWRNWGADAFARWAEGLAAGGSDLGARLAGLDVDAVIPAALVNVALLVGVSLLTKPGPAARSAGGAALSSRP